MNKLTTFVMSVGGAFRVGMYPGDVASEDNDGEVLTLFHFALFADYDDADEMARKVSAANDYNPVYWSESWSAGESTPRPSMVAARKAAKLSAIRSMDFSRRGSSGGGWVNVPMNRPGLWG